MAETPGTLVVSEVFGPTVQGEGPSLGRRAGFLRLGRCNLDCRWCFAPGTPVLMADWTERPIEEVRAGDLVLSYRNRRYEAAEVLSVLRRDAAELVAVDLDDRRLACTPDHVFATPHQIDGRRRSPAKELGGRHVRVSSFRGWEPDEVVRTEGWWQGWAAGLIAGDGHVSASGTPKVYLQVVDRELAEAYCAVVNRVGAACTVQEASRRTATGKVVYRVIHTLARAPWLTRLPKDREELAGWLAGLYDAEGSLARGQLTIAQADDKTLERVQAMLAAFDISSTLVSGRCLRIDGLHQVERFLRTTRPVLERKRSHRSADRMLRAMPVLGVEPTDPGPVVNLTTGSGFFFADGVLVEQCDTPFTWNWDRYDPAVELSERAVDDVVADIEAMGVDRVVVTGGEPLLQQRRLQPFLVEAAERGWAVEVETNGTLAPTGTTARLVERFNVSPKLANSGVPLERRIVPAALAALRDTGKAAFKFVATGLEDLDEIQALVDAHGLDPVWVMPEGTTPEAVVVVGRRLADAVVARGWSLSTRLHVLLWGDERGR